MQEGIEAEAPVKIDIIAGFLGAGKTTLINKLLGGAVSAAETVLIENEFGDVAIDDELLKSSGMEMKTLASGCICCTLRGNFVATIPEIIESFHPKRIIVEPTGMASPTELLSICADAAKISNIEVNSLISVFTAKRFEKLVKLNIPAFNMQFESVAFAVLTHIEDMGQDEIDRVVSLMRDTLGKDVTVVAKPLDQIDALELLSLAEEALDRSGLARNAHGTETFQQRKEREEREAHEHEHEHEHEHHHDHDHDHDHHHHHDSVEGVESKAFMPTAPFAPAELDALMELFNGEDAGTILRAKGFLEQEGAGMVLFEQVYGTGSVVPTGYAGEPKFVVIGKDLDVEKIKTALKA